MDSGLTGTVKAPGATGFFGGGDGINLAGAATIGGASAAARNLISCRCTAVHIFGGTVTVQGNYSGTAADGVTLLGNSGDGVLADNDAVAIIGGTVPAQGNVIANSTGIGAVVRNTAHASSLGNSIFGSGTGSGGQRLGIDLNSDGVTPAPVIHESGYSVRSFRLERSRFLSPFQPFSPGYPDLPETRVPLRTRALFSSLKTNF
ncbi:MAG: hypothetical protein ABI592_07940 [Acidobacteriota bacterium]